MPDSLQSGRCPLRDFRDCVIMGIGHQRRKPGDTSVCKPGGAEQPGGFSLTEIEDPGQLAVDPEASKQITDEANEKFPYTAK